MFYVSISNVAIEKVRTHAQENVEKEVIGLLTGRMENSVLVIEDAITGEITSERTRASLTPEAIAKIAHSIISGKVKGNIVGWYHSHPGNGVFISDIDMRTQMTLQQFSPYIVSLVIDPTKNEIGFFTIDMHTKSPVLINEEYTHMFNPGEEVIPPKFQEQNREEPYPHTQSGLDIPNRAHSREMRAASNSRRPRILYIMVTVVAIACLLVASSIIILLPRPEGTPTAVHPEHFVMSLRDTQTFFANFSDANPPYNCTWYINGNPAPEGKQENVRSVQYVLDPQRVPLTPGSVNSLSVNITDENGAQMSASENSTVQIRKRFVFINVDSPVFETGCVWNETVKINGTLFIETEDPVIDLQRARPTVILNITTVFSNGGTNIEPPILLQVENGSFHHEYKSDLPPRARLPASVTVRVMFQGNNTVESAEKEKRFTVGKRNATLTIDTSVPEYISGLITDTHDQRGIANATIVISNQTTLLSSQEIDRDQTDLNGTYEKPWNSTLNRPGYYMLVAKFGENDLYNASFSNSTAVCPNSTVPVDGFKKLASAGGNATFRVNVTNTGFLRDEVNIVLSYQRKNSSGGYESVPNVATTATVPSLLPNQEIPIVLSQSISALGGDGKYRVICVITSSFTKVHYDRQLDVELP